MRIVTPLIATPVSHLFEDKVAAHEISEVSDCLEARERTAELQFEKQWLFHIDIDLPHNWGHKIKEYLRDNLSLKPELKLVTLQASRVCEGLVVEGGIAQLSGKIYSETEMIQNAKKNVDWLRNTLGDEVKIGMENNNYYPTKAYDIVTSGEFISELIESCNIHLLLDIAHAMVTAHNMRLNYSEYIATLPLNRLIQLHICQPNIPESSIVATDAHEVPDDLMIQHARQLSEQYKSIEYLTIEYYKDKNLLIDSINKLREAFMADSI
jgi:hypothetical protein